MLRKLVTALAAIFVIYYLVTQPVGAAYLTHSAYNGIHALGHSLAVFVNSLSHGR
jgi:hypothetical protein